MFINYSQFIFKREFHAIIIRQQLMEKVCSYNTYKKLSFSRVNYGIIFTIVFYFMQKSDSLIETSS